MKLAALILLLANVAFFIWFRLAPPAAPGVEPGLVRAGPIAHPLKLRGGSGTHGSCLLFEASMDATAARARAAQLRRRGFKAQAVARRQRQASGYWVLLPDFPSDEAARAAAAKLRKGGIKDLFVLGGATGAGATVSLGLFRDLAHARKRAAHVRTLGYRPQIRERFRTTPRWTVQVPASSSANAAFPGRIGRGTCRSGNASRG